MSTSQQGRVGSGRPQGNRRRQPTAPARVPRRRVTIQRIHPWSVLKLSLIFYFCLLLVVMVASMVLWSIVVQLGVIEGIVGLLAQFQLNVQVNGGNAARLLFLVGLIGVVLWSAISVLLAFLYNLIADLVGGLRVTLSDDDIAP